MRAAVLAFASALVLVGAGGAQAASPEVWKHWSDGKAELSGYRLTQPRYGQLRQGTAILIYVTEPFSRSARVKADPGRHPEQDVETVLKLNVVKDFQTGLYDYNLMSSLFVAMDAKGGRPAEALKFAFSSHEWCGHVYEELKVEPTVVERLYRSYFDGESSDQPVPRLPGGLLTEELLVRVRGLPEPFLAPGQSKALPLLLSVERSRFLHQPLRFVPGKVERSAEAKKLTVPAGTFEVDVYTATAGEERYVYSVERAFPQRIVAWEGPEGERAELLGSQRLPYWTLNQEGHERFLKDLGLPTPR